LLSYSVFAVFILRRERSFLLLPIKCKWQPPSPSFLTLSFFFFLASQPGTLLHVSHSIPNITSYNHVRAFFGGTEGLVVRFGFLQFPFLFCFLQFSSTHGDLIVRVPPFKQEDLTPFSLRVSHDFTIHEDIYTSAPNISLTWANNSDIGSASVPSFGPPSKISHLLLSSFIFPSHSSLFFFFFYLSETFFGHPSNFAKKRSVDPVSTSNSILLINCYPTDKAPGFASSLFKLQLTIIFFFSKWFVVDWLFWKNCCRRKNTSVQYSQCFGEKSVGTNVLWSNQLRF